MKVYTSVHVSCWCFKVFFGFFTEELYLSQLRHSLHCLVVFFVPLPRWLDPKFPFREVERYPGQLLGQGRRFLKIRIYLDLKVTSWYKKQKFVTFKIDVSWQKVWPETTPCAAWARFWFGPVSCAGDCPVACIVAWTDCKAWVSISWVTLWFAVSEDVDDDPWPRAALMKFWAFGAVWLAPSKSISDWPAKKTPYLDEPELYWAFSVGLCDECLGPFGR